MALADPVDLVREACTLLAGYMDVLEREAAEPSAGEPAPGMTGRAAEAPLPGNAAALYALMDAWETIPRLEAALRYAVTGHPGYRTGRSRGNIAAAMDAIPKLTVGLGEDAEGAVVWILERRITAARSLPAIDQAQRWRYVPHRRCRYCECASLKVALDARGGATTHVECFGHDATGRPCRVVATMATDSRGRPGLAWPDGLFEPGPDG